MRRAATVAAMGLMLTAGAAFGQTAAPPASPFADFQVSPRFWYVFDTYGPPIRKQNPLLFNTLNGDQFALGGVVLSARPTALPETTLILSALGGTNDVSPQHNQFTNFLASPPSTNTFTTLTSRVDLEFLAQTAIPQSDAAWILGGRVERHDDTFRSVSFSPNPGPRITTSSGSTNFTVKGGLTGALPLTADGNLRLFGNSQLAVGVASPDTGPDIGIVGPDLAVGLQYAVAPNISVDARYRAIVYFLFDTPRGSDQFIPQYVVQQGPMIGINIKF